MMSFLACTHAHCAGAAVYRLAPFLALSGSEQLRYGAPRAAMGVRRAYVDDAQTIVALSRRIGAQL